MYECNDFVRKTFVSVIIKSKLKFVHSFYGFNRTTMREKSLSVMFRG